MATYTKETALYDTAAISGDIDDASTKATAFLAADSSGIMVYDGSGGAQTPSSPAANTQNVFIDSDSLDIRKGTTVLATFGTETSIKTADGTELAHFGYDVGQAQSGTAIAPYYTLGTRRANSTVGNYSVAEGRNLTASGASSHAEGDSCYATGHQAHAEGSATSSLGLASHSEGYMTGAEEDYSHSQNEGTIALKKGQTALGTYNEEDTGTLRLTYGDYAVIIGNGTSNNNRSNALTVDWDGNVEMALNTSASSGSTDYALYQAITALGWQNDVID